MQAGIQQGGTTLVEGAWGWNGASGVARGCAEVKQHGWGCQRVWETDGTGEGRQKVRRSGMIRLGLPEGPGDRGCRKECVRVE